MKSFTLVLALAAAAPLIQTAHAAPFTLNNHSYNVDAIVGTGPNKTLLEIDFGTNAAPDAHLFAYQWSATAPTGRTLLQDLQAANLGLSFTDTFYPNFNSYLINTLHLNANQPADNYPNAFWYWFTSPTGTAWSESFTGYSDTSLASGTFYAWALQHDDPNLNYDFTDPNAIFYPASHYPAPLAGTPVPEPLSAALLAPTVLLLLRRKR